MPSFDEFYCTALGVGTSILYNLNSKRPPLSRVPLLVAGGIAGYFVGVGISAYKADRVLRREVWIWDYVNQHPEDFPELQNKIKFKDVLKPWSPIR